MDKSTEASSTLSEWAHLYQHGLGTPPPATPAMLGRVSAVADSTVVTTTTSSPTVAGPIGSPTSQPPIEGRVGKSGRRRSRASRRAPTTLLNTDTTNFRAMVQQFTGIPSGTYFSGCQPSNAPVSYFGLSFNDPIHQATAVTPFAHLQQQHQPQVLQQQQQQQIYGGNIFTAGNNDSRDDIFNLQGFSNPRASLQVTDGFFLDGMSGQMGMPRPATTAIGTNGFFS